jgi:hypothetical protein
MQSLTSLASEVRIEKPEIASGAVFRDAPIYVWYEWNTCHTQFTGARRVYMVDAVAWWSHEANPDRRGSAWRVAQLCCEVYVTLDDNPNEWKKKGVELSNETLDNLVVLFAMQNNLSFETQGRLGVIPTL